RSRYRIVRRWRLAALAAHDPLERFEVRAIATLGEKRGRVHDRELLRHRRCDELIDTDPVFLCAPLDFGLDGARETERVRALSLHGLILLRASAGISNSIPKRCGTAPKSRRLNVTIASACPL